MKHAYFEILLAIANEKQVQWDSPTEGWKDNSATATLYEISRGLFDPSRYRVKPETIIINRVECMAPNPDSRGTYKLRIVEIDGASAKKDHWVYFGNIADRDAAYDALIKPFIPVENLNYA
jgi:hypothetical protein